VSHLHALNGSSKQLLRVVHEVLVQGAVEANIHTQATLTGGGGVEGGGDRNTKQRDTVSVRVKNGASNMMSC
jgi:hypothetical protein